MKDHVVSLVLDLYARPDAGSCLEARNCEKMKGNGFCTTGGWPECYMHPCGGLIITVYVDDLKLAGPTSAVKSMWKRVAEVVSIEPPTCTGR